MKAFIRSTNWDREYPDVIRVELEVPASEGVGANLLSGNYLHIYGESRWGRFLSRFK